MICFRFLSDIFSILLYLIYIAVKNLDYAPNAMGNSVSSSKYRYLLNHINLLTTHVHIYSKLNSISHLLQAHGSPFTVILRPT